MTIPDAHTDQPTGPQTPEEAAFLAAFRELDEADRVFVWAAILTSDGAMLGTATGEGILDAPAWDRRW